MIEHNQHLLNVGGREYPRRFTRVVHWALNIDCWIFSLFFLSALSLCAQSGTNGLPALIPAYGPIQPSFWGQHRTAIILLGIISLIIIGLITWLVLRPRPPVAMPPEVVARAALANLANEPETGIELTKISQVLRQYVITAFGLPPAELTTAEFCTTVNQVGKIGPEEAQSIASFLHECDQRKFAPAKGGQPLNAASRALEIVSHLEERRSQSVVQK